MRFWRWADWIAPVPVEARVSLGEGDTPLIQSRRLGPQVGLKRLYFKLDSLNPSGSYKDRFAAMAISHMRATGKTRCFATSSGNTGAALAAYCAAAGIRCEIGLLETAPAEKMSQMLAYGANLYRVRGFGADGEITRRVLAAIARLGSAPDAAVQISAFRYSPAGMNGVQTLSFELAEQFAGLGAAPDHVFCQAGGGGLCLAVARGFSVAVAKGLLATSPRIECVQPAGNDTIAGPLRDGRAAAVAIARCTSDVSGLQVPSVIDGDETIRACRETGGTGHLVADDEVWRAQAALAADEGVFCEPAAAASVAGALQARAAGRIAADARVVCLITGTGFKDRPAVERMVQSRTCPTIEPSELEARAAAV